MSILPVHPEPPSASINSNDCLTSDANSKAFQFTETQDWFSHNIPSWKALFPLVVSPQPRILEIGSWEDRSAVFLLQNLHGGPEIVCIDHFDLFHTQAGQERYRKLNHNLGLTGKQFHVLAQFSVPALMQLLEEEILKDGAKGSEKQNVTPPKVGFDWVYVDGSHEADDTFLDGELAWRLARKNAIFIFDDYHWDKEPEESKHHPKRGVDAFLELHRTEYTRLTGPEHYQVVVQKTCEMRIGFLVDKRNSEMLNAGGTMKKAFGYGIHIALVVDTAYAIGAAVVISSTIENTPGRITFYIVDCGISEQDNQRLKQLISPSRTDDVTMMFISLPEDSLGQELGPLWAKLDLAGILPVERILYLDGDVLIRSSIEVLWNTDLQGETLAAAPDVGHPMGHAQLDKKPYFNAGVLLIDVAKMRTQSGDLKRLSRTMKDSKFRDQDVLNSFYANKWTRLSLKWNAQGMGTYARYPSPDRDMLRLLDPAMDTEDPAIVHFTGPVNPSVEEVLSVHVQPPTAKPWGYLGAPGHPFQAEWWAVAESTAWNYRKDREGKSLEATEVAVSEAIQKFKKKVEESHLTV
ncbi:glycosyltransferase family 8 protein [Collybiopsis luxurians FD-317 M1]|uniref:Glycosyltransferase family 8 protein n=1 Tax=Collybiopsis luxurians FD-317 M1 TaxID=944289 RepID=A0A0D0BA71_9AGAR|nr:glycosyltransferase family 8 protein [Collybiopsis luxurians FD-317 M1]